MECVSPKELEVNNAVLSPLTQVRLSVRDWIGILFVVGGIVSTGGIAIWQLANDLVTKHTEAVARIAALEATAVTSAEIEEAVTRGIEKTFTDTSATRGMYVLEGRPAIAELKVLISELKARIVALERPK